MAMKGLMTFALAGATLAHTNIGDSGTPDLTTLFANESNTGTTVSSSLSTTITSPIIVVMDSPPTPTGTFFTNATTVGSPRPTGSLAMAKMAPTTTLVRSGTVTGDMRMPNVTTTGQPVLGRGNTNGVSIGLFIMSVTLAVLLQL